MQTDIFFRAFEIDDATFINSLRRIEEMENLIGGNKRFISEARDRKWIEDLVFGDYKDRVYVAICKKENNKIIGYTSIVHIDHYNKCCEWGGIKLHTDYSGAGYGTQAALMLLKFAFEEMNMERFVGRCLQDHNASKKMMEKVGLSVEGLERNSVFKNGKYQNQFLCSILKEEYLTTKEKFDL